MPPFSLIRSPLRPCPLFIPPLHACPLFPCLQLFFDWCVHLVQRVYRGHRVRRLVSAVLPLLRPVAVLARSSTFHACMKGSDRMRGRCLDPAISPLTTPVPTVTSTGTIRAHTATAATAAVATTTTTTTTVATSATTAATTATFTTDLGDPATNPVARLRLVSQQQAERGYASSVRECAALREGAERLGEWLGEWMGEWMGECMGGQGGSEWAMAVLRSVNNRDMDVGVGVGVGVGEGGSKGTDSSSSPFHPSSHTPTQPTRPAPATPTTPSWRLSSPASSAPPAPAWPSSTGACQPSLPSGRSCSAGSGRPCTLRCWLPCPLCLRWMWVCQSQARLVRQRSQRGEICPKSQQRQGCQGLQGC